MFDTSSALHRFALAGLTTMHTLRVPDKRAFALLSTQPSLQGAGKSHPNADTNTVSGSDFSQREKSNDLAVAQITTLSICLKIR